MAILDDLKTAVDSALGADSTHRGMIDHAIDMVKNHPGGLQGLCNDFKAKGLGDAVNSWIAQGKNMTITPQQIQSVMGNEKVKAMAAKAGVTPDQASSALSAVLPHIVDKLCPNGQLPAGASDLLAQATSALKGSQTPRPSA